jgi:hypothetical protein
MKVINKFHIVLIGLFFVLAVPALTAESQLSVPLDSPVYNAINIIESRGILIQGSLIKPYSRSEATDIIKNALENGELFTDSELQFFEQLLEDFSDTSVDSVLSSGSIDLTPENENLQNRITTGFTSEIHTSPDSSWPLDIRTGADIALVGGYSDVLSYNMNVTLRYDNLDENAWLEPQYFSWPNEGFYFAFKGSADGTNVTYGNGIGIGFNTHPELALSLLDKRLLIRWGMFDRQWGSGMGSIVLSDTAKPFDAIELDYRMSDHISFNYMTGTLTHWKNGFKDKIQNMYTMKRVELTPFDGLKLGVFENVIWLKRLELGYLNPFMVSTLYQNILGDWDNMGAGVDFEWRLPIDTRIYGSFMVNEMNNVNPMTWFKQVRNIFGFQAGAAASPRWLPLTTLRAQYTRLEPFFYTHYPQDYLDIYTSMNTNYQNKGMNLGYQLQPNSDEILVSVTTLAIPTVKAQLDLRFMRHSGQYGDSFDTYILYKLLDDADDYERSYSEKEFSGTLTELRFTSVLKLEKKLSNAPISIFGSYGLTTYNKREVTSWYEVEHSASASDPAIVEGVEYEAKSFSEWSGWQFKQAVSVGFTLYY